MSCESFFPTQKKATALAKFAPICLCYLYLCFVYRPIGSDGIERWRRKGWLVVKGG